MDSTNTAEVTVPEPKTYEGGCHCGAVRFRATTRDFSLIDCNCSICKMKGYLHMTVKQEDFTLLQGEEFLTLYTFNTGAAKHRFCNKCGIHSFYTPRSHPDSISVNGNCLDGDVLGDFHIVPFDGKNWEKNVEKLREEVKG